MAYGHTVEVLRRFTSADADMVVLRLEWTHGIYRTRERAVITVWLPALGEPWAVDPDGHAYPLPEQTDPDPAWRAVHRALRQELASS